MNGKRTTLVTGGNRGIGLAIVKELAKDSANKVLMGSRLVENGLNEAAKLEGNIHVVELDLSTPQGLERHIQKIMEDHPQIDVLINNAALLNEEKALTIDEKSFNETVQVNLLAAYQLIRKIAPTMIENKYGRIVNISSGWGAFSDGLSGPFSYSLTKASLNALTLTLSQELPSYVKVNSMCPGWVRTRMGGMMATRSPEQGAETAIWLANLDDDAPSGLFFRDKDAIAW